jgi:hypothetical protein
VLLDLAANRRDRERAELRPAGGVEAVDRVDQPDGADLDQVLQPLTAVGVAPSEHADEREVELDHALARRRVPRLADGAKKRSGIACSREWPGFRMRCCTPH